MEASGGVFGEPGMGPSGGGGGADREENATGAGPECSGAREQGTAREQGETAGFVSLDNDVVSCRQ